ncbi:hypothetical protein EMCRGX_G005412 [Ephydatia muelleri]
MLFIASPSHDWCTRYRTSCHQLAEPRIWTESWHSVKLQNEELVVGAPLRKSLNAPPEKGEGQQGDIKSLWRRVRLSPQLCQATINLSSRSITIAGRILGPLKKNLICRVMNTHVTRWKSAKDQGRTAQCVAEHPASNHWVSGGKYTSFSEYRLAFKARLIFLPTRTVRKRSGEPIRDTSCPKCHEEHKTLANVINHCPPHVGLVWQGITTSAYRLLTTSNDPAVKDTAVSD